MSDRTVRNWLNDRNPPTTLVAIERELFGDNSAYDEWRGDLRRAFADLTDDAPTEPASETPPTPIPRAPPYFLGRDADIAALRDALLASVQGTALLVLGGPGIGKTALTKAVASAPEIAARFGDARWFVALENAASAETLQDAVTRALGVDPAAGFAAALAVLRARPGLIVLDNLETPWGPVKEREATHESLAQLAEIEGVSLLASFRGQDAVGGPAWSRHPLHGLEPEDAATLFRRFAPEIGEDDPDLPKMIAALGGIPLAIELVARQNLGRTSLAALWRRWTDIGAALAADPEAEPGRLSSLPHSIELSLASERMSAGAHRLFRLLGRLPTGLCAEDRDALLGDAAFEAENLLRALGLAIEREGRLDLLPPIRDHAARRHRPAPPDDEAWLSLYLDLTRRHGEKIGGSGGRSALLRLGPEFPNIEAAIRASLAPENRSRAMVALDGFGRLARFGTHPASVLDELAVACRNHEDLLGEARCKWSQGIIALDRSDHAAAGAAFDAALPLYRQVGSVLGEASCIRSLGEVALRRSDHAAAGAALDAALPLFRQVGSVLGEVKCIWSLGVIALRRSDHAAARTAFDAALALCRQVGDVLGEANCIWSLGGIALRRSEHAAAGAAFDAALALYRQVGNVLGEANCIQGFGDLAAARADPAVARARYDEALALYRQVGDMLGEANCIQGFGDLAAARADPVAARARYEEALALYRRIEARDGERMCQ